MYKDRPFSYMWAGAGQQAALESNFGVGGFGYPALVAFKPKVRCLLGSDARRPLRLAPRLECGACTLARGLSRTNARARALAHIQRERDRYRETLNGRPS
jgi:hypothetical protein